MTQDQLVDHIKSALDSGVWHRNPTDLPGAVRLTYKETLDTPNYAKETGRYLPSWDSPTYERFVSIMVWRGKTTPKMRVSLAPWMGATDQHVSNTRAAEILANPNEAWNGRGVS